MNCTLIETPRGDGTSDYACPHCPQVHRFASGLARAKRTCLAEPPPPGPGTHLAWLIKELGIRPAGDCGCIEFAAEMDRWDGCQQRRAEIVDRLKSKLPEVTWRKRWGAGWQLLSKHASWFRVCDPFGSIVDEAIRRAEASAAV